MERAKTTDSIFLGLLLMGGYVSRPDVLGLRRPEPPLAAKKRGPQAEPPARRSLGTVLST